MTGVKPDPKERGCSSGVERLLSMHEVPGSIPCSSIIFWRPERRRSELEGTRDQVALFGYRLTWRTHDSPRRILPVIESVVTGHFVSIITGTGQGEQRIAPCVRENFATVDRPLTFGGRSLLEIG